MSRKVSDVHLHHTEEHFTSGYLVRGLVIGMSDGLTVPFALAAGVSGAVAGTHLVVTAGLAEIAAGSIAMGLGGYLAARGEAESYANEEKRERAEVRDKREIERAEISQLLADYGVSEMESRPVVEALARDPENWVRFMMRFELGLALPNPSAGSDERAHDRPLLRRGRALPISALPVHGKRPASATCLGRTDAGGAGGVRLCEGQARRPAALEVRTSNRGHRRPGSGGCVRARPVGHGLNKP